MGAKMTEAKHILRLNSAAALPAALRGAVVAIGNFDGVHLGHRRVLETALAEARAALVPALVFSFEPHPRSFFNPQNPVFRLTNAGQKAECFKKMGFDAVIEQNFDAHFAALPAEAFIEQILKKQLGAACIVAGENFHFGHKREGTPAFLLQAGRKAGMKITLAQAEHDAQGQIISSSRIRAALEAGDIAAANALLGRAYAAQGRIIRGRALGRQLGFPTANMALPKGTKLKFGIYAVQFSLGGQLLPGVASFGRRPTVEQDGAPLLETFIFDFDSDIYGRKAEVLFVRFLRGEQKFASTDALIAQMRQDAVAARAALAKPAAKPDFPG